jgi:hypothetical protein
MRSSNGSLQGTKQKPSNLLKALGARRVTRSKFHTENSQILDTTVHPWFAGYRNQTECYEISCYKRMSPFFTRIISGLPAATLMRPLHHIRATAVLLLNDRRKLKGHVVSVPSTARPCEVS